MLGCGEPRFYLHVSVKKHLQRAPDMWVYLFNQCLDLFIRPNKTHCFDILTRYNSVKKKSFKNMSKLRNPNVENIVFCIFFLSLSLSTSSCVRRYPLYHMKTSRKSVLLSAFVACVEDFTTLVTDVKRKNTLFFSHHFPLYKTLRHFRQPFTK